MVLNALGRIDRGRPFTVTFDEYHQGYGEGAGIMSLLGTPARLALAQLLGAFLLLVFAVSRRFGLPIPLKEEVRGRSEYLSSMSALLKKAHATSLVRRELGSHFVHGAASALGLPPTAHPEAILEATARRCPNRVAELHKLLLAATAIQTERPDSEASIFMLSRDWYRMRKELKKSR